MAIDLVALPYHGTVDAAHQGEVCRSKAKGGTTHFFTYATAYAVVRGRRYTLAMCRVRTKQRMDHVLRTLLARLVTLGIRIKLLLLDRGFYSVRVIQDLITGELLFIMPAVKRGKKSTTAGGPTGTYALAAEKQSHWTTYTLQGAKEGQVAFDLAVVCHNTRGHRGRHQREALLYATWGVTHWPLRWIRATYRSRFGIESSYHQLRIKRVFVPAVVSRPCVCCLWGWRWCCATCGCGCMPKSWRSPNVGRRRLAGVARFALPACCCGC